MGGSWDATNVVDGQVAVVTPIALDHERFLGGTVEEIATEKSRHHQGRRGRRRRAAGAARWPRCCVERGREVGATLAFEGNDFGVLDPRRRGRWPAALAARPGRRVRRPVPAAARPAPGRRTRPWPSRRSRRSSAAASRRSTSTCVRAGLAGVDSPGRLEIVRRSPTVLVDAAHNPAGAQALRGRHRGLVHLRPAGRRRRGAEGQGRRRAARGARAGAGRGRRHPHHVAAGDGTDASSARSRPRSSARTGSSWSTSLPDALDRAAGLADEAAGSAEGCWPPARSPPPPRCGCCSGWWSREVRRPGPGRGRAVPAGHARTARAGSPAAGCPRVPASGSRASSRRAGRRTPWPSYREETGASLAQAQQVVGRWAAERR